MADKPISGLRPAEKITATDMFVLEQDGTAKNLTGQVLMNWLVDAADGHGGIHSIEKVSTDGLEDTYRITLADTTTFDFVVSNGKGITSITKTGTNGLTDTYTIRYNDNTTGTFTVTNGAKGDKGDNQYIWIKYASQEPNSTSHSFGDLPDNWIGVYSGNSATAPTDWTAYRWFEIKGEQGDPGNPAVLVTAAIEYQASDSGTVIPSGAWTSAIPMVGPGRYLWTRTTSTFNTGSPVVSYSVSRMGIDGMGSVVSVNNLSPDANGNITIDASALGALSKYGATMEGPLNMNGQTLSGLNDPASAGEAVPRRYVDLKTAVVPSSVTSGNFLVGNGQGVMQSKTPTEVRGIIGAMQDYTAVPVSKGGTGIKSVASGNFLVGTGTDTLAEKTPAEVQMLFGSTTWTELYTNPDPGTGVGAITLEHDMTPYDMVAIQYNYGTTEAARISSFAFGLVPKDSSKNTIGLYAYIPTGNNNLRRRLIRITKTYVEFENGAAGSNSSFADACLPIRVYGISGVFSKGE